MKILTISTLFPYQNNPKHGVFVETRLKNLRTHFPDIEAKVIAPIPYFPLKGKIFGSYSQYACAPKFEVRYGIDVFHPRYLVVPKIGMTLTPLTLEQAIYKQAKALLDSGYDFDLIDGHYFYPDGVAIANVAKRLNKPFTVTARGTDINLIPKFAGPKKKIQDVLLRSDHNMAVCEALRQEMISLGTPESKVSTLRNGVDLELFSYKDSKQQKVLRSKLKLPKDSPIIISAGHLIERKGHHLVIEALTRLPDVTLLIAGDGPEKKSLEKQCQNLNVSKRIRFLGSLSQNQLADYYGASNALILASSREGWANVLLESMACGTPVVATNLWGTPEVVQNSDAGLLVDRDSLSISNGIQELLSMNITRENTRAYAENFKWFSTSEKQNSIFSQIIKSRNAE
ncbi:glycosyltransferase family 4 protein [Vibrio sp.]|nr:glycosyltransferase family 4 protein [Vibrio sp.]